jgi:hypothetical protein
VLGSKVLIALVFKKQTLKACQLFLLFSDGEIYVWLLSRSILLRKLNARLLQSLYATSQRTCMLRWIHREPLLLISWVKPWRVAVCMILSQISIFVLTHALISPRVGHQLSVWHFLLQMFLRVVRGQACIWLKFNLWHIYLSSCSAQVIWLGFMIEDLQIIVREHWNGFRIRSCIKYSTWIRMLYLIA